jgi:hypothetical protein
LKIAGWNFCVAQAEISKITGDIALNIVRAYTEVREHADKMTADVTTLQARMREQAGRAALDQVLSEASGLNLANRILLGKVGEFMRPMEKPPPPQELWKKLTQAFEAISKESDARIERVKKLAGFDNH